MSDKVRAWILILLASVVLGLSVSQCIREWKPTTQFGWTIFVVDLLCAIISIVYIAKNARLIGSKSKDEDFD
jgi:hypothetical protein